MLVRCSAKNCPYSNTCIHKNIHDHDRKCDIVLHDCRCKCSPLGLKYYMMEVLRGDDKIDGKK